MTRHQGLAGPAERSSDPAGPLDLTWSEVADALWLATRAGMAGDPTGPARAGAGGGKTAGSDPQPSSGPEPPSVPPGLVLATDPPTAAPPEALVEPVGAVVDPRRHSGVAAVPAPPRPAPARHPPAAAGPEWAPPPRLSGARSIARGLRPLKQVIASPHASVLDEPATAEQMADHPVWWPVLRPADERRWDALVVVDSYASMAVWRETVRDLITLLRRQGAFRDVRVLTLDTDVKDPADVAVRGPGGSGLPIGPAGLLTATGRRIVFVVTDGAGPAWSAGAVSPLLWTWGQRLPVVVIHLLAQQQWTRTGIRPHRVRLRAPAVGAANARLAWQLPDPTADRPEQAVPVPVLEIGRPGWLAAWAKLVAGLQTGWAALPAMLAVPGRRGPDQDQPDRGGARSSPRPPRPDARQRVMEFTSWATPTARMLATHLAAAPLNLPVMRTLQRQLLPRSDTSHLSEVLYSGLLRPVVPPTRLGDGERVTFEFEQGVREELLAVGRRADTVRVLRIVDRYLGPRIPAVRGLSRVIEDPDAAPRRAITSDTAPFVRVEQLALQALGGLYLARSRELGGALGPYAESDTVGNRVPTEQPVSDNDPPESRTGGTGVTTSTDALPAASAAPSSRTAARAPAIWGNVPPRNPNFTGRDGLLDALHAHMRGGTTAVLPHALHGMGGVGKSALAVEYVYRHQGDYDLIWWVPAERTTQVGAALVELAQRMRLPVGMEANTAVPAVREALRLGEPYANWLLVFDNAESPEAVREFFPTGGPGSIMVTSRNPHWANTATPLEVDVFSREESVELLRRRGPELDPSAADRLAEALGDLPLALEQAAAWRAETGMPVDEYLRLLEDKRVELLAVSPPVDYQIPVAAAWNLSLDGLVVSNPAALRLLQVCAFFAPEPIPRTLLSGARGADIHPELNTALRDPMRLNRAIRDINRYALARIDYRINSIQMHRLVQAVLVDRMPEAERAAMRRSSHVLLASSDRNDPVTPANWRTYAELLPHVMASGAVESDDPWVVELVDNEVQYLYWWGDHDAARELAQVAYDERRQRLGVDAPATLAILRWLSFMHFVVGRYAEAAELNERLVGGYQRAGGGDTEQLLRAIGATAADRRVAGDFYAALEIDEDLYRRHLAELGPDYPETLVAAHNLAVSVRLCGDFARAREIDEETQRRKRDLYGEDHPVTLETTRNLVIDRRELGEYVRALSDQQEVVDRLRQVVVQGHPQLLRAQRSLSATLRKSGDHQQALALSREVYAGFLARYGEGHPDTLAAAQNLAIDLRQAGELDEAIELGSKLRDGNRRLYGDRHPHTVAAAGNLAIAHRLRGDADLARHLNEEARGLLVERLGPSHPLTLAATVNLASDLFALGETAAAYAHDDDTAQRLGEVFGPGHPTTLACRGNLAIDLRALGREADSAEVYGDVVARFQRTLGDDHPAAQVAHDLAVRADCDLDPMPL